MSKKDKALERAGLLNYQTKGLSQDEINSRLQSFNKISGYSVDKKWAGEFYGGATGEAKPVQQEAPKPATQYQLPTQAKPNPILTPNSQWNYKGAQTDMKGNPLKSVTAFGVKLTPKGFDPNGEPWFGGGLGGYLKKVAYKFQTDEVTSQEAEDKWKKFWDTKKQISETPTNGKSLRAEMYSGGSIENVGNERTKLIFQGVSEFFSAAVASGKKDVNIPGTAIKSPLSPVLKITSAALGVALDAFQAVSELPEQAMSINKAQREFANQSGTILPDLAVEDEDVMNLVFKEGEENVPNSRIELRSDFVNFTTRLLGAGLRAYDEVRFWTAPGTLTEKTEAIKSGWVEGRLLYSELVHPAIDGEYQRRAQAGEDPYLLAMELEDPWAELGGELLLDPFNLIGIGGKAKKFGSTIQEVTAAVEKSGPLADPAFINMMNDVQNVSTPAQASVKLDDMADYVTNYTKTLDLKQSYKATALNAAGNQMHYHKVVGNVINNAVATIRNNGGSVDDVLDYVVGVMKRGSGDPTLVKEGITAISKGPMARISYNKATFETGAILNAYMGEGDSLVRALKEAGTDWNKMRDLLDSKIKDATKFAFPSVNEMQDAAEKLKKFEAAGNVPDKKTLELAKQFEELKKTNPGVAAWNPVQRVIGKFVGEVNGALANTYFSLNYGYAFRNTIQNFFTLAVDGGFSLKDGLLPSTAKLDASIIKMAGGMPPSLKGKTFTEAMTNESLFKQFFSKLNQAKLSPAALSDLSETYSGKLIYAKYFRQTMDDAMSFGKGLPDIAQWEAKGFTAAQAKDFKNILRAEDYDSAAAIQKFNSKYGAGSFDRWRTLDFVDPNVQKGLEEYENMWGEIVNLVSDPAKTDQQAVMAGIEQLKTRIKQQAAKIADEVPAMPLDAPEWKSIADARSIAGEKLYTPAMQNQEIFFHNKAKDAVRQMNDSLKTAANKLIDEARVEQDAAKGDLAKRIMDWIGNTENSKEFDRVDNTVMEMRQWAVEVKKGGYKNWDTAVLGPRPDMVDRDTVARAVWDHYFGKKMEAWQGYYATYLDESAKLAKETGIPQQFAEADKAVFELNQYRNLIYTKEGAFIRPPKLIPAQIGTAGNASNISAIAKSYMISSASKTGVKSDKKLLNIINQYIRETATFEGKQGKLEKANNALYYLKQQGGINPREFADIFGGTFGRDKAGVMPGLFQQGSKNGIDYVATRLVEGGFMTADEAADANKVRDYLRSFVTPTAPNDAMAAQMEFADLIENGYSRLDDVPVDTAEAAFKNHTQLDGNLSKRVPKEAPKPATTGPKIEVAIDNEARAKEAAQVLESDMFKSVKERARLAREELKADDVADVVDTKGLIKAPPPHDPFVSPSGARVAHESKQGVLDALNHVADGIRKNWGLRGTSNGQDAAGLLAGMDEKLSFARARSMEVADKYRDFALLPYGETKNMDFAMSLVYPYQFWYSRSYSNWMKRAFTTNPEIISRYANLKDTMAKENKDLPDWWKYQVKFGDPDNPMYFNLEATVWPLYGLTGTDFNDPDKRTNWFTATLDDAGKFGPSVWSPLQWGVAAYYSMKGEKDIAAKWGGRMIPQTSLIKAGSSFFGTPIELDPNVQMFSGSGLGDFRAADPYEEGRISRALSAMEAEGKYTEEQLIEAARTHTGEIWDEAYQRAIKQRAPGSIMSSLFGVGFKPRTQQDIETDNFYAEYGKVRNLHNADMISDEQYKQSFNELREKYPFMDVILLSRRAGVGREAAYAYNVISRIPPGMTKEIYDIVGIDPETAAAFYDAGGKFTGMSETEQQRFMTAMTDAGAMLAIPSNATREEWTAAKNTYGQMRDRLSQTFGDDIQDKISLYYGMDDRKAAKMFLAAHPEVGEALDAQTAYIANNPQLLKYYGGIDTIEKYNTGVMYDKLEEKYGGDITDIESAYFDIFNSKAKKAYLREHPELKDYWNDKDAMKQQNLRNIVRFGNNIPKAEVSLTQNEPANPTQRDLQEFAQPAPQMSAQEWQGAIGAPMMDLISDYWYDNKKLPTAAKNNLDYLADQYGYESGNDMLQAILMTMPQQ